MIVYACEKCKYTDLFENAEIIRCPRCSGRMVSLGVSSGDWNDLDSGQKDALICEIVVEETHEKTDCESEPEANIGQKYKDHSIQIQSSKDDEIRRKGIKTKKVDADFSTANNNRDNKAESRGKNYSYKTFSKQKRPRTGPIIKPGVILVLVVAVCVIFALNEQRNSGRNAMPLDANTKNKSPMITESSIDNGVSAGEYKFENCLYYDSINDADKEIYQIAYDLVMHKDNSGYSRTLTMDSFEFAERENGLFLPFHAMLSDHPELFYMQSNGRKFGIRTVKMGSIYKVTFTLGPGEPDENKKVAKFEKATEDFLRDIDLNASAPEIELQIHDKLIDLVAYDYDLLSRNSKEGDLGFTAYGALVEDSRGLENRAVCGGYAQAFQYLLQKAGIEAAYVSGYADSESNTLSEQGSHAWNIVKLDGEWYEVDACWDDIDAPPDEPDKDLYKIIKYEQPQYFNATHHWYNITTEEMCFLPEGNTVITVRQGNIIHELRPCAKSTHQRTKNNTDEGYDVFVYLNQYLPQASGTKYAMQYPKIVQ